MADARNLALDTDRVLVAHGAQEDPIFEYGNAAGLQLWETGNSNSHARTHNAPTISDARERAEKSTSSLQLALHVKTPMYIYAKKSCM